MSVAPPTPRQTLPLWATAQLIADWWSDPTDPETGTAGLPLAVRAGERSDPTGPIARAAVQLLGDEADLTTALATAIGRPDGLADEYERLMVGPGRTPCPPYESMWDADVPPQRGITMGSAAGAVLALYRRVGLTMRPHPGELPDHLVVEWEAVAWSLAHDGGSAVARALLADHLLLWLPRFCEQVAARAGHPYYQALAALTPAWATALSDQLQARNIDP